MIRRAIVTRAKSSASRVPSAAAGGNGGSSSRAGVGGAAGAKRALSLRHSPRGTSAYFFPCFVIVCIVSTSASGLIIYRSPTHHFRPHSIVDVSPVSDLPDQHVAVVGAGLEDHAVISGADAPVAGRQRRQAVARRTRRPLAHPHRRLPRDLQAQRRRQRRVGLEDRKPGRHLRLSGGGNDEWVNGK